MKTKIAKEFRWEMSHRLPYHSGQCKFIHGHSYKLNVAIEGEPDDRGMVLDYYNLFDVVNPILKDFDHSFVCDSKDNIMIDFLKKQNFKYNVLDTYTSAENLAKFFLNQIYDRLKGHDNLDKLYVRLQETEDVYAEVSKDFQH